MLLKSATARRISREELAKVYPIVERRLLDRVKRKVLTGRKRDVTKLPRPRPGTVLIFESGGRYEEVMPRHLTGREDTVRDAIAVSLVDKTRDRLISTMIKIPSKSVTGDFSLVATFECTVTDAIAVVRDNTEDLGIRLSSHIKGDMRVHLIGNDFDIGKPEDVGELRRVAYARVLSWCKRVPPHSRGVHIRLKGVEVLTPDDLRRHLLVIKREQESQTIASLREDAVYASARKFEAAGARGPEATEAVAYAKGEVSASMAATRAFDTRDEQNDVVIEVLRILEEGGHLDRSHIDPAQLINRLGENLFGSQTVAAESTLAVGADGRTPLPAAGADGSEAPGATGSDSDDLPHHESDKDE